MSSTNFRLPAEWERQAGVLLAWPHAETDWADRLADVETTFAALARAIAAHEPVLICVGDEQVRLRAQALLGETQNCRFVQIEYDDTWLRDSGPITLCGPDAYRLLDFRFTGWGGKFIASRDDRLVGGLAARELFRNADHCRVDWALEGGAIESDGAGTILTTWRCLHERHPGLSREEITTRLAEWLRQDRVLWLDHGYLEGDDTDAHIDTLARFARTDAIVFQDCSDADDPHYPELQAMAAELAAMRTAEGTPYRLFALPWPKPIVEENRRLAASYANFLIVNGAVLMPAYGDPADAEARSVLEQAFPGREIVPVPCRPLIWQNGSLHCITMQLPQGLVR